VNRYIISFLEAKQDNEHLLLNLKKRKRDLEETNINLKKHIEKNESLKEKLVQQESLAGLGVLTSGLAHEIRNPLNFIINSSVILEEIFEEFNNHKEELKKVTTIDVDDSLNDAQTSIKLISSEGKKANLIVTHLLSTYSNQKESDRTTFNLNKLIESVAQTTQLALKGKVSSAKGVVEIELDERINEYKGHESELNKVLLSIIYNSFEAIEEKYSFDPENYKPLVKVESKVLEDNIIITIYDNGIGVKEKNLSKVFTPFFTTKPTNKATGLGMSSSYEIIKNLFLGDIKLDSQQGQFTRVEVIIPLKPED
jgi:signal transduction histidine kinase